MVTQWLLRAMARIWDQAQNPLLLVGIGLDQIGPEIAPDEDGAHAFALVQPMHAVAVRIAPATRYSIDGNTDGFEINSVGGPGRHGGIRDPTS